MKKFKWDTKYLYWGITAFCVIVGSIAFFWVLRQWSGIARVIALIIEAISPFIYGFLFAYMFDKILIFFEDNIFSKLGKKMFPKNKVKAKKSARIFSIIVTELLVAGVVAGILVLILPQIYEGIRTFISRSSDYATKAISWIEKTLKNHEMFGETALVWFNNLTDYFIDWLQSDVLPQISTLISNVTSGVINIVSGVIDLFIGGVIAIYVMYHKETFRAQSKKLIYSVLKTEKANHLLDELKFINNVFGNFVVGEILDATIIGIACYTFMLIARMPYSAIVSVVVCITNLIPVFGPFIGAIPSAFLILLENPMKCLIFIIFIVVLQQLDGNVIKPAVLGRTAGLSGFWIMFAILLFGGLFGVLGMLLGVPILTVLYNYVKRFSKRRLTDKGLPDDTEEFFDMDKIDPETKRPVYKQTADDKRKRPGQRKKTTKVSSDETDENEK